MCFKTRQCHECYQTSCNRAYGIKSRIFTSFLINRNAKGPERFKNLINACWLASFSFDVDQAVCILYQSKLVSARSKSNLQVRRDLKLSRFDEFTQIDKARWGKRVFQTHSTWFSHSELIISINYSFLFQILWLFRPWEWNDWIEFWILIFLRLVTYRGIKSDVRVEEKWKRHFIRDTLPISLPVDTSGIMFLAFVRSSPIVIRVIYAKTRVAKETSNFLRIVFDCESKVPHSLPPSAWYRK